MYAGKCDGYDLLVFSGYLQHTVDHSKIFGKDKVHIHGLENFWIYAKKYLVKHNRIKPEMFSLYIKEMELRYNVRDLDRFLLLLDYLLEKSKLQISVKMFWRL